MKRAENSFKRYLLRIMGTTWDVQSHEDKYTEGIPDLSYGALDVGGWIELKQVHKPVLASTPLRPKKYTMQQVNWMTKRAKRSGHCFIMVKVGDYDYFIFDWRDAKKVREGMTIAEYHETAIMFWKRSIDPHYLIKILARHE